MACIPINQKYKNSYTTFTILIGSFIILHILLTSKSLLTTLDSNYTTIILFIIAFTVGSYVYIYDPTMLCGALQKDCRKKVAIIGMFQALLFFPAFSLLIKQLLGEESILRWIVPLTVLTLGLTCCWIKYKVDPNTLINSKFNILKCHRTRLIFYMIILAFDTFNLPQSFGFILVPIYILYTIIYPVINDTIALDGAVKYDIKEINST
jgi:hypothetical protein